MSRSRLFSAFVALVIGACLACSESGSGSESNFVECTTDAECDGGACINKRCEAPPVASSTDGGGSAGTEGGASGGTAGSGGTGGAGGSAGMFGTGGVVVGDGGIAAGVAEPCSISPTGFPGDEFCILAPSPNIGFQVHFGPPNYDEPAAREPFLLAGPVTEIDACVYVRTPNTSDVYVSESHLRARQSVYEAVVMRLGSAHPDGLASCQPGFDYSPLAWSAVSTTVDVPDGVEAPENAGLAMRIPPDTQLAIRVYSIQTCCPQLAEAWVNFIYEDPATVTTEVDPLMLVAGTTAQVPMGSAQTVRGSCTAPADMRILDLSARGHVPSGERVTIWKVSGTTRTVVYESYGVDFAPLYYDSVHQNAQPDPTSGMTGGHNGVLDLAQGESLEWECEIVNSTAQPIQLTEASPGCRVYGRYAPSFGGTWSCISP